MKKFIAILMCLILTVSLCSCGGKNSSEPTEEVVMETEYPTIIPDMVSEGSEAYAAVEKTVEKYLDTFISCDFDAIKAQLHEDDAWLFNFESEDQMAFYNAIFPLISYEFEFVAEHDGVYGIMTRIISPDMADVYGTIITEYLDISMNNDTKGLQEFVNSNTERMIEMISSPDIPLRDERLYIYVEYINGEYIPRCDAYLANELTGGAPEASGEISETLNESVSSLME